MLESGVPASITLAQSMLESDEAKSKLSATHKNFF
jgi:flagellum-specific peptidoglycan hydrolase FlgJ